MARVKVWCLRVPAIEDVDRAASVVGAVVHIGDEEAMVRRHGEEAHPMQAGERDVDLETRVAARA